MRCFAVSQFRTNRPATGPFPIEELDADQISGLAVLETLLFSAASVYLVAITQSWVHVGVAACLTPFLLLRTRDSAAKANMSFIVRSLHSPSLFCVLALAIILRITTLVSDIVRQPLQVLRTIPQNWQRSVFFVDFSLEPEAMPGTASYIHRCGAHDVRLCASSMWTTVRSSYRADEATPAIRFMLTAYAVLVSMLLYGPSLVARVSVKATAWIFIPLVWAVSPISQEQRTNLAADARLALFARSDFTKMAIYWSLLVIVLMVFKIVILIYLSSIGQRWALASSLGVLDVVVRSAFVPMWQIASLLNALMWIVVVLYARHKYLASELGVNIDAAKTVALRDWLLVLRRVLTTYSILCTVYLMWRHIAFVSVPEIELQWLPWI